MPSGLSSVTTNGGSTHFLYGSGVLREKEMQTIADYQTIPLPTLFAALFAIGLGLSIDGLRANIGRASLLSAVKLVIMPLIVYGLSVSLRLDPLYTIAAVICAAVPTAKTAYILAGEYHCEEMLVASTVSMTTLASVISLVAWLYWLSGLATRIPAG
jgi:predicted Na+-dependent transporter